MKRQMVGGSNLKIAALSGAVQPHPMITGPNPTNLLGVRDLIQMITQQKLCLSVKHGLG